MRRVLILLLCLCAVLSRAGNDNSGLVVLKEDVKFNDLDTLTKRAKIGKTHLAGSGSGFFVTVNGCVVTNHHVVDGADELVMLWRGLAYLMVVEASDAEKDLAVLRPATQKEIHFPGHRRPLSPIEYTRQQFPALKVRRSRMCDVGDTIYVIGYPQIGLQGLEAKVTKGIISSLSGFKGQQDNFQMDAAIQYGNSGGPVIDEGGYIVGVTVARLIGGENVNYAIKLEKVEKFLDAIKLSEAQVIRKKGNMIRRAVASTVLILRYDSEVRNLSIDFSSRDARVWNEAVARREKTILYAKLLKVQKEWADLKKLTDTLIKELGKYAGEEIKELNALAKKELGEQQVKKKRKGESK